MAKLSTGASYGDTNKQTSQRLVGAAEQTAVGGELARQQMAQAALQPAASPVNTFQQVGAPTLGGPVKFFAPPDLPPPSQDLANLAKSLGGFSSTLNDVGDFLVKKQKLDEERADLASQQAAQSLSVAFPGQQFAQVRDSLYRQAQAGDEDARAKYEYLQSLSPLTLSFVQRNLARLVYRQALASAFGKWEQMPGVTGPDGKLVPMENLRIGDPLLMQAMSSLLPTNINDPVVVKEHESQAYGLLQQLSSAHNKTVIAADKRRAMATMSQVVSFAMTPGATLESGVQSMNQALLELRQAYGAEVYREAVASIDAMMKASADLNIKQAGPNVSMVQAMADRRKQLLDKVVTGANGETLINSLGAKSGDVAYAQVVQDSMESLRTARSDEQLTSSIEGQRLGNQYVTQGGLDEPGLTPVVFEQRVAAIRQRVLQELPPGPLQSEALQTINSAVTARDQAIVQPLKNEAMREADRISRSTDPPEQRLQQLDELARAGMVDPKDLTEVRNRIERERNELESPDGKARQELIDAEVKRLERFLSVGGLSDKEQMQIVSYKAELRKNVAQIVNNGHSQRLPSDQIDQKVRQFLASQTADLTGRIERNTGVNRQPLISDINKYYDDRGLARNGRPPMGQSLRSAVDNAVVMPKPDFEKALNDLAFNNSISPQINQIIKDSGYGGNAGDFFLKQWKQQYPGIPFPEQFKTPINRLNGQRLSFAAPPSTSGFGMITPGAAFQRDLGGIINTIVNQTIGGASAATREPTTGPIGVVNTAGNVFVNPVPAVNLVANKGGYASDTGLDIHGPEGTSVVAALPGRIVYAERGHSAQMGQSSSSKGYKDQHSVLVELDQPFTFNNKTIRYAWYSHLQGLDPAVAGRTGARISAGQRLGAMGIANKVSHLHIGFVGDREQKVFLNYKEIRELFAGETGSTTPTPRATTRSGGGMTGYSTYYTGSGGSDGVAGGPTANGERFDPRKKTAAVQWSLRNKYLNKWLLVEDLNTGKAIRVWANDTGQMGGSEQRVSREDPRIIDLSPAAFTELFGGLRAGKARIRVRIDKNQRRS